MIIVIKFQLLRKNLQNCLVFRLIIVSQNIITSKFCLICNSFFSLRKQMKVVLLEALL